MRVASIGVLMALACLVHAPYMSSQEKPVFRSGTTLVAVNVSVRAGNLPVGGLSAKDFTLTDNGVAQAVTSVAVESVPFDVTLLVDTSGSVQNALERLKADARSIIALLRKDDSFRLLTVDTYVHEVLPMQSPSGQASLALPPARGIGLGIESGGATSLYDGLIAAMIQPLGLYRPHLVVAMSDGWDTMSAASVSLVCDVARSSEAVLHIVAVKPDPAAPGRFPRWMPHQDLDMEHLREAAVVTGGQLHDPGSSGVDAFKKVYQQFRHSYVLQYEVTGVASATWHEIAVRVNRPGKYSVQARKGYTAFQRD